MTQKRVRVILAIAAVLQIVVVLLFSGGLNIASFRKNYVDSLVSSYTVAGGESIREIEYSVKYGKPLDNFAGMTDILAPVKNATPDIEEVNVVLADGRVVYDLRGAVKDRVLPEKLKLALDTAGGAASIVSARDKGKYHALLPIRDRKNTRIGSLDIVFDESVVERRSSQYLESNLRNMLLLAVGALLVVGLLLAKVPVISDTGEILKRRLSTILLVVLGVVQVAYGVQNVAMFRTAYLSIAKENTALSAKIIKSTIDDIVSKGIPYAELLGIDDWMHRVVGASPEIERLSITGKDGKVLYTTAAGAAALAREGFQTSLPLVKDRLGNEASINLVISESYISGKIRNLALDSLTVLITSVFFLVELLIFLSAFLARHAGPTKAPAAVTDDQIIRPLAFIFLISSYMSISFIPVVMRDLYRPLLGLPKSMVIALPISVEMAGAMLATILTGYIIDRRGWRPPFFIGLVFSALGTLLSGFSTDAIVFVVARGVTGVGYGLSWMALRGFVAAADTGSARSKGFSALNAGIFAGMNCGSVLGAMLAERLGFSVVFFLALIVVALSAGFALLFIQNVKPVAAGAQAGGAKLTKLLLDPSMIAFFLLITIPSAVAGMFLNYFFPLHAKGMNISQGNIGRAFLLYGICIIYFGPILMRQLGKRIPVKKVTIVAGFVGAAALAVFCLAGTFWAAITAIFLLGIADSIGLVSQNTYFVNLPVAQVIGQGKSLSVFSAAKKIGQMLGPTIFGWAAVLGTITGIWVIAAAYAVATAFFWFVTREDVRAQAELSEGVDL